jgi:hypothetical protein
MNDNIGSIYGGLSITLPRSDQQCHAGTPQQTLSGPSCGFAGRLLSTSWTSRYVRQRGNRASRPSTCAASNLRLQDGPACDFSLFARRWGKPEALWTQRIAIGCRRLSVGAGQFPGLRSKLSIAREQGAGLVCWLTVWWP